MTTTSRTRRYAAAPVKTPVSTPRRFLRCISCGTLKKERSYALCAECYRTSGALPRSWFVCFVRHADREAPQYSFRNDPRFEQACRVYARRRQRAEKAAALDSLLPPVRRHELRDLRNLHADEEYDGLGPYDLLDLVEAQYGAELPKPERSEHRELSDTEIARWDARVDAWAAAHGLSLTDEPAPELRPWGYAVEIDGALVWTDDLVLA
ncbi:MAG TPA: hypothetical protein VFU47_05475 [Armatimonadota bacterium]|nr:hypothetical protein [Armatimonadota bacterium]